MKFSETLNAGPSADAMTEALPETLNAGPLQGLAFRVPLKPASLRLLVLVWRFSETITACPSETLNAGPSTLIPLKP